MEANWKWAQEYWLRKSKEFRLDAWSLKQNKRKTCLAICNYTKKEISISIYYLSGKLCTLKSLRNTILHEIAHALAGKAHKHDLYWKAIAVSIGCDGEVCGKMDSPPRNWLMYCPKKCFNKEYYREPNIKNKVCLKCKSFVLKKKL